MILINKMSLILYSTRTSILDHLSLKELVKLLSDLRIYNENIISNRANILDYINSYIKNDVTKLIDLHPTVRIFVNDETVWISSEYKSMRRISTHPCIIENYEITTFHGCRYIFQYDTTYHIWNKKYSIYKPHNDIIDELNNCRKAIIFLETRQYWFKIYNLSELYCKDIIKYIGMLYLQHIGTEYIANIMTY